MPYIVRAEGPADRPTVSTIHEDRRDALATALLWGSEGRTVQILGNGKIYSPEDLAAAIINNE